MRCVRITAPKEPLVYLEDEPIPKTPEGGAVVKISYSGVCHSDVHYWEGGFDLGSVTEVNCQDRSSDKYPRILGHEIAGMLYSLDENVSKDSSVSELKLGDRVVVYPWIECSKCRPCKMGYNMFCDGSSPAIEIGITQDGGFAQYVAVPDLQYLVPVSASIPSPIACLLPCSGLTAYHAVEDAIEFVKTVTEVTGGCSVLVSGAGGLGQWAVRLARALFPPETQILCTEVKQEALDLVTSNVSDVAPIHMARDESNESVVERVKAASRTGTGVDLVLDFVGVTKTFQIATKLLTQRGRYQVIGLLGGQAQFSLVKMVLKEITMKGIAMGSLDQLKRLVQLMTDMPSLYTSLQYDVHPLQDGISVLEKLAKGEVVGRAVLRCSDGDE